MTINDQIRDEKLQYHINREAAKISVWSSDKILKYKHLTGKDILPSDQQQIIEQTKCTYSPLGKAFKKQTKTIEDQGQKQAEALKSLESKSIEGIFNWKLNKLDKINEYIKKINQNNMIHNSSKETINFNALKTIRSFGEDIYGNKFALNKSNQEQADLVEYIVNFNNKTRPKNKDDKKVK